MGKSFRTNGPVPTTDRLAKLRALLKDNSLDAWVAPTDDAHASECEGWKSPCRLDA